MKERKLNYRFHNPNSAAATANYILKILIEANTPKVEATIKKNAVTEAEWKNEGKRNGPSSILPSFY